MNTLDTIKTRLDVLKTRKIIEDVMVEFLFEPINEGTIKKIKTTIAQRIEVRDNLDFFVEAINEGYDIAVKVKIRDVVLDEEIEIVARYTEVPVSLNDVNLSEDHKKLLAYNSAMEIING